MIVMMLTYYFVVIIWIPKKNLEQGLVDVADFNSIERTFE